MRSRMVFALVVAGGLVSGRAVAQPPAAMEKEARKACLAGDYAKGVSILAELFVNTEDPTYLYNQGRCYEQNVRYTEAAERFREFLRKAKKVTPSIRAETEKHIADCEAAAIRTQQPTLVQQPSPNSPPISGASPPPAPPAPPPEIVKPHPIVHPWQHTAKWIASGAAVAFLSLGIVEHLNYYRKNDDFNSKPECTSNPSQCKSLADSADTAQIVAFVGYGAAAVATGLAITFWLTDSPKQSADHVGLGIVCSPALAGIHCRGRF